MINVKMEKKDILNKLEEFNKFACELVNLSFVEKMQKSDYAISWGEAVEGVKTLGGPDDEAVKAFVNDIRRFFQKGDDALKIDKLQPIYQSAVVEESEKKLFSKVMSDLDKFKKHTTGIMNLTNERILEVFLYGKISHRSKGTKDVYDKWEETLLTYPFLKHEFHNILYNYLIFINNIVVANKRVIMKLKNNC